MSDSRRRYYAVKAKLRQLLPDAWQACETRMTNLSLLVSATVKAKELTQPALAAEMPLTAQDTSLAQRQRRWLSNEQVDERALYEPLIRPLLHAASARTIPLTLDTTDVGANSHLLTASMSYQQRAVPVAWSAGEGKRGHTRADEQLALLDYVCTLLPAETDVVLLGDGEFGHVQMLEWLSHTGWDFVFRVAQDTYVQIEGEWRRLDSLGVGPGTALWLEDVWLTQSSPFGPVNVLLVWDDQRHALLPLVTRLPTQEETQHWYRRRFWIEPFHGDIKGHGFDWQTCRLRHPDRIQRLMLVVALAYLWMLNLGVMAWFTGAAKLVDRSDRRDRSLFSLGRQWLNRLLKLDEDIHVNFLPYPLLHNFPEAGVG